MGAPVETDVDVNREFMPAGQGVGAIKGLIPAGDLVRQIMAEAERVIDAMKKFTR
jgi:NAD(P)H-dependent flavin oxidoreductase YrpB (nitropropane dioxygenase family)